MIVTSAQIRERAAFAVIEPLKAHVRRVLKARQLRPVVIRSGLEGAHLVTAVMVKNEAHRLPALLRHYRGLGVEHFIVIDNESTDGLTELLGRCEDVSIYRAQGSFASARYGIDWLNTVLSRHCSGKWVVHVDADEFLVFDSDLPDLPAVCSWLEDSGRQSLQALMVDMYSGKTAIENVVNDGQDPLEVCNLFDGTGYERHHHWPSATTWVKGGVRGRLFFPDRWEGPALNKTPLVLWRRRYAYLRAAHLIWPRCVNGGLRTAETALLHFKFTPSSSALMVDETHRAQHTTEYRAYDAVREVTMVGEETREYRQPSDLTRCGLIARVGSTL
ncbi:glycosyltransferase family 2 protein [Modestobacter excelsi]|uniref:glycosyltransferase family 2 protein n=1 Tax=Modestobacter excelsi TaxID=2213161 RepID=UPI00110CA171|nr:glycosyltransferase family 2 protein [Modestobacter excelsi]